jgi:hypothetical protein
LQKSCSNLRLKRRATQSRGGRRTIDLQALPRGGRRSGRSNRSGRGLGLSCDNPASGTHTMDFLAPHL